MSVQIKYLISHSSSLSCHTVIKGYLGCVYNKNKTSLMCWHNPPYITWFSQLVPWNHSSYGLPGHQLWKPHDVRQIISKHSGGFVFYIPWGTEHQGSWFLVPLPFLDLGSGTILGSWIWYHSRFQSVLTYLIPSLPHYKNTMHHNTVRYQYSNKSAQVVN